MTLWGQKPYWRAELEEPSNPANRNRTSGSWACGLLITVMLQARPNVISVVIPGVV